MIIDSKRISENLDINYNPDLRSYIEDIIDFLDILETKVTGKIKKEYSKDGDILTLDLHIESSLILACAITMLEVPYFLEFDTTLVFGPNLENSDYILTREINLDEIVFAQIYMEKPYSVLHPSVDKENY
ncbi:MAG: DUF177 domain-containing protein [Acholeplasmatales bacterium]|nr:DUF177 domain-containing protein [Acholeplasmatales bacterium]